MANEQNLIPFTSDQSQEEAKKNGRLGGIQSGVARRRKKTLKQAVDLAMSLPVKSPKAKKKLKEMGFDMDDADNQMAVIVGVMSRAMNGDPKAAALIFDLLEDGGANENEQAVSHSALIDAIRNRSHED